MSEEETRKAFSNNLRYYMNLNNLNQADISRLLGVSESAVGKWMKMKSTPRMGMVEKLADYFGIKKSDLLESRRDHSVPEQKHSYVPETIAAHFEGKEFSDEELDDIARFIDFVASKKGDRS